MARQEREGGTCPPACPWSDAHPDGLATRRPLPHAPLRGPRFWPLPPWQKGDIVEYMGSKYVIRDLQQIDGELTVLLHPLLEHIRVTVSQLPPDGEGD